MGERLAKEEVEAPEEAAEGGGGPKLGWVASVETSPRGPLGTTYAFGERRRSNLLKSCFKPGTEAQHDAVGHIADERDDWWEDSADPAAKQAKQLVRMVNRIPRASSRMCVQWRRAPMEVGVRMSSSLMTLTSSSTTLQG